MAASDWMRPEAVAKRLGVTTEAVNKKIRAGRLSVKCNGPGLPRWVPVSEVEAWEAERAARAR